MSAPVNWEDLLDAFGARVAAQRLTLEDGLGGQAVAPFAPPAGLGPCPPELWSRAADLLQEATELQAELEVAMAATSREMTLVRRLLTDRARPPVAGFVDRVL